MRRLAFVAMFAVGCATTRAAPAHTVAYDLQCQDLLGEGKLLEADAACAKAVAQDPRDVFSLHNRATIAFKNGDLAAARGFANEALRVNPEFAPSLNSLGAIAVQQGDLGMAAVRFKAALVLMPDFIEARWNLGELRRAQKDWPAAEREFRVLTEGHPDLVDPWIGLARVLAAQGLTADARAAYGRCLAIDELPECVQELAALK